MVKTCYNLMKELRVFFEKLGDALDFALLPFLNEIIMSSQLCNIKQLMSFRYIYDSDK